MSDWSGRLRSITMAAPDPEDAARRWAAVLSGVAGDGRIGLGDDTEIVVTEGPLVGLLEMRFDAAAPLLDAVGRMGARDDGDGLVLRDPDGWPVRFTRAAEVAPMRLEAATLSHCTLLSARPMDQCDFWQRAGMRLSDTIGGIFGWLRPNPVHHSLAFSAGPGAAIHHLAVEFPDAGSLIAGVDALVAAGSTVEFGPGRHIVGGNLFAYALDDTGIRWELCAELQRVPADEPPHRHPESMRARSVNRFGPRPPQSFIDQPGGPGPLAAAARYDTRPT